jgi:hypothetical protein
MQTQVSRIEAHQLEMRDFQQLLFARLDQDQQQKHHHTEQQQHQHAAASAAASLDHDVARDSLRPTPPMTSHADDLGGFDSTSQVFA